MNRGLINGLDAGFQTGSDFFMYIIKFDLTNDGFNSIPDLINNVFAILGYVSNKGISEKIYNEKSLISYINFLYGKKEDLDDELTDLLQKMGQDLKNLYVSGQVYMKYDEKVMKYWLSKLQPSNALFVIGSGDFQFGESVEKIAFKRTGPNFKQNNKLVEKQWEVYDDFMKEIHEDIGNYRLKTGERRKTEIHQNETKLTKSLRESLLEKKGFKGLIDKRKNNLCRRQSHNKRSALASFQGQSNDTNPFTTWLYTKKLNKFDEQMMIYYRSEQVDALQLLQFSSYISNFESILPNDLMIYESNPYIPNDLSLVDNQCVASIPLPQAQKFEQRLLTVTNFTDPINSLIHEHLKGESGDNNSKINGTCFDSELTKDKEFTLPDTLMQNSSVEAWVKTSREFSLPQVQISMLFHYPNCGFESFMLDLFTGKLKVVLDSQLIDARILGYSIDINKDAIGMNVRITGFHDKIEDIVRLFSENLQNLTIEEQDYESIRMLYLLQDAMGMNSQSVGPQDEVIQQAEIILKLALTSSDSSVTYGSYLQNADYGFFMRSVNTFKKEAKLKVLFFGNILENDAQSLLKILDRSFTFQNDNTSTLNLSCIFYNNQKLLKVPEDVGLVYRTKNLNPDDSNHAIINYYQYGALDRQAELKTKAFAQTFNLKAFDYLRTANQLGYVVIAQPIILNKVLGIAVFIQGSKKSPYEMDGLIEDFLRYFEDYLYNMDEANMKQELENIEYEVFERRNIGFFDKSDAYWSEIYEGDYNFAKNEVREMLKGLNKGAIMQFYLDLMKNKQRKLSIQVYGGNETMTNDTMSTDRNYAGKGEKLIDGFNGLDLISIVDNKLKFYKQS